MKPRHAAGIATIGMIGLTGVGLSPALAAHGAPAPTLTASWAPAATATIHPGVQTFTQGAQCTANFIYTSGTTVYIGQAAHCAGTGSATSTNGCSATSLPLGTQVTVTGASKPGTIVYSSWIAMQAAHETNSEACAYNDIALVQLDPADVASVNPSVPKWGGPIALGSGTNFGDSVYTYGNSELRFGITALSPKTGVSLGDTPGGWSTEVYTATPGIPGDSGSAVLDSTGKALGDLVTVAIAPIAGSNGVSHLDKELAWAAAHGTSVTLVPGTEAFNSSPV